MAERRISVNDLKAALRGNPLDFGGNADEVACEPGDLVLVTDGDDGEGPNETGVYLRDLCFTGGKLARAFFGVVVANPATRKLVKELTDSVGVLPAPYNAMEPEPLHKRLSFRATQDVNCTCVPGEEPVLFDDGNHYNTTGYYSGKVHGYNCGTSKGAWLQVVAWPEEPSAEA